MRRILPLVLATVLAPIAAPASAQDYPTRPVRMIVPFAAGGPADVYARFPEQDIVKWERVVRISGAKPDQ